MIYKLLIRPLLFLFDAETAHKLTFTLLKIAGKIPGFFLVTKICYRHQYPVLSKTVAGLHFKNPVGLAAGFDKDGTAFNELAAFGFGFIEVGTVTPLPQSGNPRPRLFRLRKDKAVINRMGFNNNGVKSLRNKLLNKPKGVIIGGNIGKNKVTPNEHAIDDYLTCFHELFPFVDYFVINISSPNTPGLRDLQEKEPLQKLLAAIMKENLVSGKSRPVFLKIAPDLDHSQLDVLIEAVITYKLAGMIVSNTTISRESLKTGLDELNAIGAGGLSGQPLFDKSTEVLKYVVQKSGKAFAVIASGGIETGKQAEEKLKAGADLVQVYTGFIYEGPSMVKHINQHLAATSL
ncbi:MAG TPA: quinone-dependent dihydroorotate dehydrogenase [Bacteroidia bacterium]|nr:quinone-dependent dihydroorotate dehydrogenase [Bacteroidia bacterium]